MTWQMIAGGLLMILAIVIVVYFMTRSAQGVSGSTSCPLKGGTCQDVDEFDCERPPSVTSGDDGKLCGGTQKCCRLV